MDVEAARRAGNRPGDGATVSAARGAAAAALLLALAGSLNAEAASVVAVVAAENFYGNIVEQLGGDKVSVTNIMTEPNADPRSYESDSTVADAVSAADLVIENGGGYDLWMDRLLSASPRPTRIVLKAYDLAVKKLPGNGRVWYSVDNMQAIGIWVVRSLKKLSPENAGLFTANERVFQESLGPVKERMAVIFSRFEGVPVGAAETTFQYLISSLGLRVITPMEFQRAVAEGRDPPATSSGETDAQIRKRSIRILIFNDQAQPPRAADQVDAARDAGIPLVGMTETLPPGESYQSWMQRELDELRSALISAGS